jgi:hypothetical protein
VDRLIAAAEQRAAISPDRQAEIKESVRASRVALRRSMNARAALEAATHELSNALIRIVEAGLNHRQAFEAIGVSVGVGRRLLLDKQHPQERHTAASSTGPTDTVADSHPVSKT